MQQIFQIFGFGSLLFLFGCFEPTKGCLDIEAANFDASADEDCCCQYPSWRLGVSQVYGADIFRLDSVYENEFGVFRVRNMVVYLSDFALLQNGGQWRQVEDLQTFKVFGPLVEDTLEKSFVDDFQLLRRTSTELNLGTFRYNGNFEGIRFRMGLSDEANTVIPSKAPANHPLRPQGEGLWQNRDNGYWAAMIIVAKDTTQQAIPDTLRFSNADLNAAFVNQNIAFSLDPGYDLQLLLTLDQQVLFKNVNWSLPLSAWKSQIRDNFTFAWLVSQ